MKRMKTETKRKVAGAIALILALSMLLSTISVITGLVGTAQEADYTEATTAGAQ